MGAPKIIVTGRGGSAGSWAIRGLQIGTALGARVVANATLEDLRAADVALVVKRVPDELLINLRRSGIPWVYDIVDAYPQPECTAWSQDQSIRWLRNHFDRLDPHGVIWATYRMRDDAGRGGYVVHHHARADRSINPIREHITAIGYEGSPNYIAEHVVEIEAACAKIGAAFYVNPPSLAAMDVMLAVRGPKWNGYAQRHWKSAVKLTNCHATGTPFIGMRECGYDEISTGGERLIANIDQLPLALAMISAQDHRQAVSKMFLEATHTLQQTAEETRSVIHAVLR